MNDMYVEIIGTPTDGSTIKMANCCNLGDTLSAPAFTPSHSLHVCLLIDAFCSRVGVGIGAKDLKLANDVIELTHDKRFKGRMF